MSFEHGYKSSGPSPYTNYMPALTAYDGETFEEVVFHWPTPEKVRQKVRDAHQIQKWRADGTSPILPDGTLSMVRLFAVAASTQPT